MVAVGGTLSLPWSVHTMLDHVVFFLSWNSVIRFTYGILHLDASFLDIDLEFSRPVFVNTIIVKYFLFSYSISILFLG